MTVSEILEGLRVGANSAVLEQSMAMSTAAGQEVEAYHMKLKKQVTAAEATRVGTLADINLDGEALLRRARAALDDARQASANQARESAAAVAVSVQTSAEQEASRLANMAEDLKAEARQRESEATQAADSTHQAAAAAQGWRRRWPRAEIQNALDLASMANKSAPKMRDLSASSESLAKLVDGAAAHTLTVLNETMQHARNANLLARTAVDQAAQNALKLKAIRQVILDTEAAATASQARSANNLAASSV